MTDFIKLTSVDVATGTVIERPVHVLVSHVILLEPSRSDSTRVHLASGTIIVVKEKAEEIEALINGRMIPNKPQVVLAPKIDGASIMVDTSVIPQGKVAKEDAKQSSKAQ